MGLLRRRERERRQPPIRWVRVAWARHQPEAEMLADILGQEGIPSFIRRGAAADVPDMLAGGTRVILVPEDRALEAHALLDPLEPLRDGDGGDGEAPEDDESVGGDGSAR